jgi:hypothetical protein
MPLLYVALLQPNNPGQSRLPYTNHPATHLEFSILEPGGVWGPALRIFDQPSGTAYILNVRQCNILT